MSNSKFIQVSSSVLLEYIYSDANDSSKSFIEAEVPLYKYTDTIFNGIKNETRDNYYTGNSINRTFESYSDNQVSLLRAKSLNESNYLLNLSNNNSVLYDSIKLHFISGFNFENNNGFIFNVKCLDLSSSEINLLNLAVTKQDSFETLNPTPFYFANKYYASYIEVKVLSLYNLTYSYYNTNPELVNLISTNGIKKEQYIQCKFSWLSDIKRNSTSEIGTLYDSYEFDLELVDKYSNISATIRISDSENYFEYEGLYKGNNIGDFLNDINSSGSDYIMLHDIVLYESSEIIGNDPIWNKTQELQLSQVSNFSDVNIWRPVIKNALTTVFKVDYILRLFNRANQSQIWKIASIMVSGDDVAKFGTYNTSINLNSSAIHKIYNKSVIKEVKLIKPTDNNLFITKQIFSYINSDISLSIDSNDKVGNITNSSLSQILVTENTTKLKFTLYKKTDKNNIPLSFSNWDTLYLNFKLNDSSNFKVEEVKSLDFNRNNGEILFKINSAAATKILSSKIRTFSLIWKNNANEITTIAGGTFFSSQEWADMNRYSELNKKDNQITELNTKYEQLLYDYNLLNTNLTKQITDKDITIAALTNQITTNTNASIEADAEKINSLQTLVNSLQKEIALNNINHKSIIDSLNNTQSSKEQANKLSYKLNKPVIPDDNLPVNNLTASVKKDRRVINPDKQEFDKRRSVEENNKLR